RNEAIDKELFIKIKNEILPSEIIRISMKEHDFGDKFLCENHDVLRKFNDDYGKRPDFEFFDPELEKLLIELKNKIANFIALSGRYLFVIDKNYYGFRREFRDNFPERYGKARKSLNESASAIWEIYETFIKLSRKKLLVSFEE
ncbi:MAG TPA: hypothetical protein PKK37_04100, partial [Candidatus Pacearchaeota archaeon]|nr:hypothetical protein [Candidatus Pacearchaeota archaeon]